MKKILLLFCVAMLSVSCGCRPWGDGKLSVKWYVHNFTDQTLILKCPYSESLLSSDFEYREIEISPKASVIVCSGNNLRTENIVYDYYFKRSAEVLGEDVSWQVFSEDGVVLKAWKYSDRNLPDQRFFDKTRWSIRGGGLLSTSGSWMFVIFPEDITLN